MDDTSSHKPINPCTRCGKERIESKSWTEEVDSYWGKGIITHTETVCPDPECQKVVDERIAAQKEKNEALKSAREARLRNVQKKRRRLS